MATPSNDPWDDARVADLVRFDEALRRGETPTPDDSHADADLDQAQRFLLRLQAAWKRSSPRIGPYVVTRSLGQGAFGPAYLVEDPKTRAPLVLKTLWPDLGAQASLRKNLQDEALRLRQLTHPEIVPLRDFHANGPFCIAVTDFCPGLSLASWLRHHPQGCPWMTAAKCVSGVAEVLDAAHRQGITHGNLKPTNLFLPCIEAIAPERLGQSQLRVSDFGLARTIQESRLPAQAGLPWPMPQYLAPEQLSSRRREAGPAADVYALGVLLYELVTGRSPVKGSTREEIFVNTREKTPPPARAFRPEIPAALEALMQACLEKKPHARPTSAQFLANGLDAIVPRTQQSPPAWWKTWLKWK